MKNTVTRLISRFRNIVAWRGSPELTLQISGEDVVVFVVGPTGSGKSWFTKEATRSDLVKPSRTHHPSTDKVQAIRCELTEEAKRELQDEGVKNIVFVDTPSFLTGCDHPDAREEFKKWLKQTRYEPRPEHVGVVYMHRVETDPALEPPPKHLEEFFAILRISGGYIPQRLLIVRSYDKTSGIISSSKIAERTSKLGVQLENVGNLGGKASMHEELFQGEPGEAWGILAELFK